MPLPTVFWALYLAMPIGSFTQSTLRNEVNSFEATQQELTNIVIGSILSGSEQRVLELGDGLSVPASQLRVASIHTERRQLVFEVVGYLIHDDDEADVTAFGQEAIAFRLVVDPVADVPFDLVSEAGSVRAHVHSVETDQPVSVAESVVAALPPEARGRVRQGITVGDLLPPLGSWQGELTAVDPESHPEVTTTYVPVMQFTPTLLFTSASQRLRELHAAIFRGDPLAATGKHSRMAYFSVSTLTTLGLGDITPITTRARIMTLLEAVLGITCVGFFLNAAARAAVR